MVFDDIKGLQAVEQRAGISGVRSVQAYGALIYDLCEQSGGRFTMSQIIGGMQHSGYKSIAPVTARGYVLNVIRYCNASMLPVYFRQRRNGRVYYWLMESVDRTTKTSYQARDNLFAVKSQNRTSTYYPVPINSIDDIDTVSQPNDGMACTEDMGGQSVQLDFGDDSNNS